MAGSDSDRHTDTHDQFEYGSVQWHSRCGNGSPAIVISSSFAFREVRLHRLARPVLLGEVHALLRARRRPPLLHPTLQRPQVLRAIPPGLRLHEMVQQRLRLEPRRRHQPRLDLRPRLLERVCPGPPRPRRGRLLRRHRTQIPVLARRLSVHPSLHCSLLQARSLAQLAHQLPHLRVGDHRSRLREGLLPRAVVGISSCRRWGIVIVVQQHAAPERLGVSSACSSTRRRSPPR